MVTTMTDSMKKDSFIRICNIRIEGMKNIKKGEIEFYKLTDLKNKLTISDNSIWGIYGQNGSGKTTVIETTEFLKSLLSDRPFDMDTSEKLRIAEYINKEIKQAKNTYTFFCQAENYTALLEYVFCYSLINDKEAVLSEEELSETLYDHENQKWKRKKKLFQFNRSERSLSLPLQSGSQSRTDQKVLKERLLSYTDLNKLDSSIFSRQAFSVLKDLPLAHDFRSAITVLKDFATKDLIVIRNKIIGEQLGQLLMINFLVEDEESLVKGTIPIETSADRKSRIPLDYFSAFKTACQQMNIALKQIVDGMTLAIKNEETIPDKDGIMWVTFDMVSVRNGLQIPLQFESEGIKRIISVLNALIFFYSSANACVLIDEMDSGVYEYLLGELLVSLVKSGKGQLIFTAHNLRPLERLGKDHIIFSTANPEDRFLVHTGIKPTNNLREVYLREIFFGSEQSEPLSSRINASSIELAIRKAGKIHGKAQ